MSTHMSMSATKLVDIIAKHNSHSTSDVEGALAEILRRVEKGCKQPLTQEWLLQVVTAYGNVDTIPRKSTVAKGFQHPKKVTKPAPKKAAQATTPRFAEKAKLSEADLNFLFTQEAQDTLACTFRPVN